MWRTLSAKLGVVALATLAIVLVACGGGDGDDGGNGVSLAELGRHLPAAADLGVEQQGEYEWTKAKDLLVQGLVIPEATPVSELGAEIEDAGFESAVGRELVDSRHGWNLRISAAQFDSEDGAREARDLLHREDLKQPCRDECTVAPQKYELAEIPDSTAAHHVPVRGEPPAGKVKVEAHHAEFVIGPQLYVVQVDGRPRATFSADFDSLMRSVYAAASGTHDLSRFLMRKGEEPGFRPGAAPGATPSSGGTTRGVRAFVDEMNLPQADARRLRRAGFISLTFQPIRGPRTAGISNVALFATAEGAKRHMAHELRTDVIRAFGPLADLRRLTLPGVPGARGWTASKPHVGNVWWVQGRCVLVLGNQGPGPFAGPLSKGARAIYERTKGECP
jgi:hypothetical protein